MDTDLGPLRGHTLVITPVQSGWVLHPYGVENDKFKIPVETPDSLYTTLARWFEIDMEDQDQEGLEDFGEQYPAIPGVPE